MFRRVWARVRSLWLAAKNERASPREIGVAVGLGVFAGCTPALGFHGGLAVLLATVFRKNRLFCFLGSRVANAITLPPIVIAAVQLAHYVRTGALLSLDRERVLEQGPTLLVDWLLGCVPVGGALGALLGYAAYLWAKRRDARRAARDAAEPPAAVTREPGADATGEAPP